MASFFWRMFILLCTLSCGMLTSCDNGFDSEFDKANVKYPDYQDPGIARTGSINISATPEVVRPTLLGLGYDLTGAYLQNSSLRAEVLDLQKFEAERITKLAAIKSEMYQFGGANAQALLHNMMLDLGFESSKELAFTGLFSENPLFKTPIDYGSQFSFALGVTLYQKTINRLNTLNVQWDEVLSEAFKSDLKTLNARQLIERYGTHILITTHEGASQMTLMRSIIAANEEQKRGEAEVGLINYTSMVMTREDLNPLTQHWGIVLSLTCQGGDASKLPTLTEDGKIQVGTWIDSVKDAENTGLTSLSAKDLLPLSEVITDADKRHQVELATEKYLHEHQIQMPRILPLMEVDKDATHRFFTSYDQLTSHRVGDYQILGSLLDTPSEDTTPLYLLRYESCDRLSITEKSRILLGYVYKEGHQPKNATPIYELGNSKQFTYTPTLKERYDEHGVWRTTGVKFYLPQSVK